MAQLLAPLALALAALALLLQALETGWTREVNSDPLVAFVDLPQLGISGLVIALACWSHATSLAFLLHDAGTTPAELAASARVARRALLTAAAVALALATAFGVTTSAHFNLYQDTFTRWPIGFAIPVVALTATAGILVTRISPESVPAWVRDCRTPVAATLVAATGILINNAGTSGTVPDLLSFGFSLATIERIGIGLLASASHSRSPGTARPGSSPPSDSVPPSVFSTPSGPRTTTSGPSPPSSCGGSSPRSSAPSAPPHPPSTGESGTS